MRIVREENCAVITALKSLVEKRAHSNLTWRSVRGEWGKGGDLSQAPTPSKAPGKRTCWLVHSGLQLKIGLVGLFFFRGLSGISQWRPFWRSLSPPFRLHRGEGGSMGRPWGVLWMDYLKFLVYVVISNENRPQRRKFPWATPARTRTSALATLCLVICMKLPVS